MTIIFSIFIFSFGLVLGSFYNVVGSRLPKGESIMSPPSHCENCHHQLSAWELIPVISYIFLCGACRKCKRKYGVFHPIMELLTAVLFVIAYLCFDFSTELLIAWLFISLFTIIVVSDICYMIIQDKILVAFGIPLTFLRVLTPLEPWWDMLVGGLFGFGLFLLIAIMSKGGMGGGDIKLYLIIGLVLGFKLTFISIILAAFIGLFVAIVTRTKKGQPLPFAPSIAVGSLLSYFYGSELFNLYLRLLL